MSHPEGMTKQLHLLLEYYVENFRYNVTGFKTNKQKTPDFWFDSDSGTMAHYIF